MFFFHLKNVQDFLLKYLFNKTPIRKSQNLSRKRPEPKTFKVNLTRDVKKKKNSISPT